MTQVYHNVIVINIMTYTKTMSLQEKTAPVFRGRICDNVKVDCVYGFVLV